MRIFGKWKSYRFNWNLLVWCVSLLLAGCHHHFADDILCEVPEQNFPGDTRDESNVVFARNVDKNKGWYDVDKRKDNPDDIMACWLITACNMLQWWQDDYVSGGNSLPSNIPNGKGNGLYKLAIFDESILMFNDLIKGGTIQNALSWYISGEFEDILGLSFPKPGTGGYLKTISGVDYSRKAFLDDGKWEKLEDDSKVLSVFSDELMAVLSGGAVVGMDIKTQVGFGGSLHAITLWGVELDKDKRVKNIYITDSDDNEEQLVCCPIYVYTDEYTSLKEVAFKVPAGKAYVEGAEWAVIRLYYLAPFTRSQN